ncbi:hypothetical protein ACFOGG_08345 [Brenneria rubrifaciens]|uniref:hypothetical protein n=1 Tax=Brenneria rubrifaciens TaxID=55213 RepID=UPI00360D61B3
MYIHTDRDVHLAKGFHPTLFYPSCESSRPGAVPLFIWLSGEWLRMLDSHIRGHILNGRSALFMT